ncbi:polar amino acid transport system substrate-binding protein [Halopseudomonas salegens]|uniref:Polar amino acid transport system substrate-binding protein n=2 Tax=Halopseudomonas salegens TaxID=1434072 RepID=A0A1H2EH40_9GAMM|nr:polar amino acid transport system substrate-binding protein [Halopseudomonas salegens]
MLRSWIAVLWIGLLWLATGPGQMAVAGMVTEDAGRLALIERRGVVRVGVKIDYPPWGMVARDTRIVGLEADLAADLAARLGVALELQAVTSANRLQRLQQGMVDVVIATLSDTPARRRMVDMIEPHYYASGVSLLHHKAVSVAGWESLRGRPVCLTEGAYFNRELIERYGIRPLVFPGTRDTLMALQDGRCVGWAYDDTALLPLLHTTELAEYRLLDERIFTTPWAVAVAKGEGDAALGRQVAEIVADWHRQGLLNELQAAWQLPPNAFLHRQQARWLARDDAGARRCHPGLQDLFDAGCAEHAVSAADVTGRHPLPPWLDRLQRASGLQLVALADPFNQKRLLGGLLLTLLVAGLAVLGSLLTGVLFAACESLLRGGPLTGLLQRLIRGFIALARMTPPILQLYIVFFGLGGLLLSGLGWSPGGVLVASLVFSCYAGATNAALLAPALSQLRLEKPDWSLRQLLAAAIDRSYEGLVSTLVNIVKAAGMASTIAVPEIISVVNTLIAEGANATGLMTLLLLFYFGFVLLIMALLRLAMGGLLRCLR